MTLMDGILASLSSFPNELSTFVLSLLPLVEMRLAFPVALFVFHLNFLEAFLITFLGSLLVTGFLFWFFPPIFVWIKSHWPWLHRLIDVRFKALELKHAKAYHRFGGLFLFLFVVDPFPGTGIWTAVPLAILLNINPKISLPSILFGSAVSALLAAFLTEGAVLLF